MVVKFSEVFFLNKEVSKLFIGTKLKKKYFGAIKHQ